MRARTDAFAGGRGCPRRAAREPDGRWTHGPAARILLPPTERPTLLEFRADAFVPPGAEPLEVEVGAGGVPLGVVRYAESAPRTARIGLWGIPGLEDLVLS